MNHLVRSISLFRAAACSQRALSSQQLFCRTMSQKTEKVVASKSTASVKREIPVINQLKRGSQKISIKSMVYLLVVTNVVLVGLIAVKKQRQRSSIESKQES